MSNRTVTFPALVAAVDAGVVSKTRAHAIEKSYPRTLDHDTIPGMALTTYKRHDTPTLPILKAVNEFWREIQANNPGTPNVNIVLQASERAHGHFAPGSWQGAAQHELMLSTISLALMTNNSSVIKTVSTLLHEAAHAYAHANNIQDTSRQGRWHNKEFARVAERFGCEVTKNPQIGHTTDGITSHARALYAKQIQNLMDAVTVYRRMPGFDLSGLMGLFGGNTNGSGPVPRKPRKAYGSSTLTIICECGTAGHRVPRALYESSVIHCTECDSDYTECH